jgi:hypothetical protein
MARITTSEKVRTSRSCLNADRAHGAQPQKLRLEGVRPMTSTEQQRFEMLFDALITRWLARYKPEGEDHD